MGPETEGWYRDYVSDAAIRVKAVAMKAAKDEILRMNLSASSDMGILGLSILSCTLSLSTPVHKQEPPWYKRLFK